MGAGNIQEYLNILNIWGEVGIQALNMRLLAVFKLEYEASWAYSNIHRIQDTP